MSVCRVWWKPEEVRSTTLDFWRNMPQSGPTVYLVAMVSHTTKAIICPASPRVSSSERLSYGCFYELTNSDGTIFLTNNFSMLDLTTIKYIK
jgi:hypothetical protein